MVINKLSLQYSLSCLLIHKAFDKRLFENYLAICLKGAVLSTDVIFKFAVHIVEVNVRQKNILIFESFRIMVREYKLLLSHKRNEERKNDPFFEAERIVLNASRSRTLQLHC